jgi:excisionase family DNA binding protein
MELLDPKEVSSLTGLSIETLAQWRSQKKHIAYLKVGRLIRYTREDIEAYLGRCRVSVKEAHDLQAR